MKRIHHGGTETRREHGEVLFLERPSASLRICNEGTRRGGWVLGRHSVVISESVSQSLSNAVRNRLWRRMFGVEARCGSGDQGKLETSTSRSTSTSVRRGEFDDDYDYDEEGG